MVKEIKAYQCPICDKKYKDRKDALNCAEECQQMEYPEDTEIYQCEICKKIYSEYEKADSCEESCKEANEEYRRTHIMEEDAKKTRKLAEFV